MIETTDFYSREANEVFVGLIGIGLTLLVQEAVKWIRDQRIQHKFPVAGTYLTRYVDSAGQERRVYTDMVRLRQSGKKLRGESIPNIERGVSPRKWIFDGEVRSEGYVQGSYRPDAFTDKGFGAFFLRFEKNGDLSGYWIGKDADETKISFGEYSFLRQPKFGVSVIQKSDHTQVLRIAEERLGDAYIDPTDLTGSDTTVAVCARVEGVVAAFATARIIDTKDFLERVRQRLGTNPPSLLPLERRVINESRIGFVASAATDPLFEGRGIGAELIGHCIDGLEQRGAEVMVATAWKSTKGVQAGSLLECRGFQRLFEIPNYWESDSLSHGYSCPNCGKPPCKCSAILYARSRHAEIRNKARPNT